MELREKVAKLKKLNAAAKSASRSREKKRSTLVDKWIVALKGEPAHAKALHVWLVSVAASSNTSATDAQEMSRDSRKHLDKVEEGSQLVTDKLDNLRKSLLCRLRT